MLLAPSRWSVLALIAEALDSADVFAVQKLLW